MIDSPPPVSTIGVLGAGTMGHGIAHAAIVAGFDTTMYDVSQAAIDSGRCAIAAIVDKGVVLGKVTPADAAAANARLRTTTDLAEAVGHADLVIEAAPENIDLKLSLLANVEKFAPPSAVIGSNTSSLSVTEMAAALARTSAPARAISCSPPCSPMSRPR